jgi:hypothetical protein
MTDDPNDDCHTRFQRAVQNAPLWRLRLALCYLKTMRFLRRLRPIDLILPTVLIIFMEVITLAVTRWHNIAAITMTNIFVVIIIAIVAKLNIDGRIPTSETT